MHEMIVFALASLMPVGELRGAIPLGIYLGLDPLHVFALAVALNAVMFFPIYFGMDFLYKNLFARIGFLKRKLEKIRSWGGKYVQRYGAFGIFLSTFVGAYTGSILSWFFKIEWKRAFLAVALSVVTMAVIVTCACVKLF